MSGDEEVYEVEAIRDRRKRNGKMEYQVEWRGYPRAKDYTWEGLTNLKNCKQMIEEFESSLRRPTTSRASTPSSARSARGSTTPKRRVALSSSSPRKNRLRSSSASPAIKSPRAQRKSATPTRSNPPKSPMKFNPISTVTPFTYDAADEVVYDEASYDSHMKEHNLIDPMTTEDELPYFFGRVLQGIKAYLFAEDAFLVLVKGSKSPAGEDKCLFKIHKKLMNNKYPKALTAAIHGIVHDLY